MITKNQFEEIYPLVNEIVAFSDSFANEDNSLFRYFKTKGKVYGSNDLIKIIRSNILSDLLHCYFTLGYQQNYNSNCYVLFDLLQYAFWFDTNHFSYKDFVKYTSSQSNASYFLKGFNNTKSDKNSGLFPALCIDLIEVDQLKCAEYLSILKEIAIMLFKNTDEKTEQKEELINALLTDIESFSVSSDYIYEGKQIDNRKYHMVTNEEYEELYLLARKMVRFVNLLTNKADCNSELYKYLESIGYEFNNDRTLKGFVQLFIEYDILNCYFFLGYQQIYNRELYILLDMIAYGFHIQDVPWSYNEFQNVYWQYGDYFCEIFDIKKNHLKSMDFPTLYIYLNEVDDTKADEYVRLLQMIANVLSKNQDGISNEKDPRIDILLTYPQAFLHYEDDINESQQIEDFCDNQQVEEERIEYNTDNSFQNMNLLKDKKFNGITFEIIREEFREGYSCPFWLFLRVTNFTDLKKKIDIHLNYISSKHGLKKSRQQEFIPNNSFVDLRFLFDDITKAYDGDRIEMVVNEGKFATLRLIREKGQWSIVESIERNAYNGKLKSKIEHFEAIDEQFGITLQNFSVKVEDENSLNLFCEVLALNGEVPQKGFNVEAAIYDSENSIVFQTSLSKYDGEFKGFEVFNFGTIKLDIPVDEISKIRIYPTR
ncbi:MAG: hypothetical protein IJ606_00345 [Bacteroidaceae bacterium]|nr:hypothetical protein [Bacteroidaceae bacterium]